MDAGNDLGAKAADLYSQARSLEIQKDLEVKQSGMWADELDARIRDLSVSHTSIFEARTNRDWHLHLADAKRKQIKKLVREAEKLLRRINRNKRRK